MKKVLIALLVAMAVAAVAVTAWLLYATQRYRQLVDLGKQAQQSYESLAREYTFERPTAETTATAARWEAFLAVRERAIAAIPKSFDQRAPQILAMKRPGLHGQISFLLDLAPELAPVVKAHTEALREARMSPAEYRWMMGVAMLGAVREPEKYPAGKAYRALIGQIATFGRRLAENARLPVEPDRIPDAGFVIQTMQKEFGSYPVAPPEVLEKLTTRESGYLADIFAVAVEPGKEMMNDE
ncbi:MAG: hypothetical protein ABFD69_12995 [Candidatus Sumerlaeia bacterium]